MSEQILVGESVTLRSALGIITRTVAGIYGDVVAVCTEAEYQRAQTEGRAPLAIGFKLADVVQER